MLQEISHDEQAVRTIGSIGVLSAGLVSYIYINNSGFIRK